MSCELQFIGGAGTVTGSKYLIKFMANGAKPFHLLVDCGLFQGIKSLRLRNWDGFPVPAADIDAVILSHAHIDHSGYIPRLIKKGFKGKVYATEATRDLCQILLPDSGYLMEEEAAYLNKTKKTRHSPALPLFTMKEAEQALDYFNVVPFEQSIQLNEHVQFEFRYAGHILGASSVLLNVKGLRLGFTGDIGRLEDQIFYPPHPMPNVDYLVTESTYGNRMHKKIDILVELEKLIFDAYNTSGVILIPAFAVGRAQALLYYLWQLKKQRRIPEIPMYLNSPMASDVNQLLNKHRNLHRLTAEECAEVCGVVKYVRSVDESIALNKQKGPMLIISASGMLSGGRVLHHLKAFAPYAQNTILLTGFQAAGTRGEALERGVDEIKIHGEYVPVRARVKILDNMSAHADCGEILTWLGKSQISPRQVFVTHGEPSAADELRRRLSETFHWNCLVPELGDSLELK